MLSSKGVTRVQWIALYYLGKGQHINQKVLAEKMYIKESTVTRLVDRMEKEGLVERKKNQEDRRIVNLVLTEKGMKYREDLIPEGIRFNDLVSKDITEEEMKTFMYVLDKMVNNLRNYVL